MPVLATPPGTEHPLPAVLSLIGNTPLVEITRLDTGPCQLFVKLENQNPTANALSLARWLEAQPQVARVRYPGLDSHPQHALARQQMRGGFGGMITLTFATDLAGARRFLENTRLFALAESLGGVEDVEDLRADLAGALAKI